REEVHAHDPFWVVRVRSDLLDWQRGRVAGDYRVARYGSFQVTDDLALQADVLEDGLDDDLAAREAAVLGRAGDALQDGARLAAVEALGQTAHRGEPTRDCLGRNVLDADLDFRGGSDFGNRGAHEASTNNAQLLD